MSRKRRIPSYRHHKHTGLAYVVLDGNYHYLGKYGSPESKQLYDELLADWLEKSEAGPRDLTISQVVALFWRYCKKRYGKTGEGQYGAAGSWRGLLRALRSQAGVRIRSQGLSVACPGDD